MSKGGTQATPPVNAAGLIGAQTGANIQSAETQAGLNNANVTGPLGSSIWSPNSYDPNTGLATSYTQQQNLGPLAQSAFNSQATLANMLSGYGQNVGYLGAASGQTGANILNNAYNNLGGQIPTGPANYSNLPAVAPNANYSGVAPLPTTANYSGLTPLPTSSTDFSNEVKQAQNAAYNTQAGYLDPQFAQKQSDLTQQLADQGISAGSNAFDRAQGDLGRQETLAYQQAQDAAVAAGNAEQQALFGENLSSRQQGQNEANALWGQNLGSTQLGLNEANTLWGQNLQARQQAQNEANTQWAQPLQALAQAAGLGGSLLSSGVGDLSGLGSLGNFTWAGGLPSQGGSPSQVTPPNIGQLQSAANQGNLNSFLSGNTLNNQLGGGIGTIGSALGGSNLLFGSQGLGGALGISPTTGILGSLFGGGASSALPAGAFGSDLSLAFLGL